MSLMLKNVVVCSDFPQIHDVASPPRDGFAFAKLKRTLII
jgi:hypothetical protein